MLKSLNRVAVLLPAAMFAMLAAVVAGLLLSGLQNRSQVDVLRQLAARDSIRIAEMRRLSTAAEAMNSRLLGVMADVYSPGGSVAPVEKLFVEMTAAWKVLEATFRPEDGAEFAAIAQQLQRLDTHRAGLVGALQGGGKAQIAKTYDQLLDVTTPLRRALMAKSSEIDESFRAGVVTLNARAETAFKRSLALGLLGVVLAVIAAVYALAGVARPLGELIRIIDRLRLGETGERVRTTRRTDEIGTMFQALEQFRAGLAETDLLRAQHVEAGRIAQADRQALLAGLIRDLDRTVTGAVTSIEKTSEDLANNASAMSRLAGFTTSQAETLGHAASHAATGFQSVAAATEQMNVSIDQIMNRVSQSAVIAQEASQRVAEADGASDALGRATENIGAALGHIRAIAARTNLLALNATIEAARAGEAGRGFAIVAGEVKDLAGQVAKTTDDIGTHVDAVQRAGSEVHAVLSSLNQAIAAVHHMTTEIAASVSEQQGATSEISSRAGGASGDFERIRSGLREVQTAAGRAHGQAESVTEAVGVIREQSRQLRAQFERFVDETRSAA